MPRIKASLFLPLLPLVALLFFPACRIEVTGMVRDELGNPIKDIPGTVCILDHRCMDVRTDFEGRFKIRPTEVGPVDQTEARKSVRFVTSRYNEPISGTVLSVEEDPMAADLFHASVEFNRTAPRDSPKNFGNVYKKYDEATEGVPVRVRSPAAGQGR